MLALGSLAVLTTVEAMAALAAGLWLLALLANRRWPRAPKRIAIPFLVWMLVLGLSALLAPVIVTNNGVCTWQAEGEQLRRVRFTPQPFRLGRLTRLHKRARLPCELTKSNFCGIFIAYKKHYV